MEKNILNSLISVLIPAYNHEKYVEETIKSIISQSYKNIELIIVDDGSQDNTFNKIMELEKQCKERFANVIFTRKENEGIIKTLNFALEKATGEYIYLIASDDIAEKNAIETLYNFLSNNQEYALVVGDNYIIDELGQKCYWDLCRNNIYDLEKAKYKTFGDYLKKARKDINFNSIQFGNYRSLVKGNYIPNGYLIRKSIIDQIGGYSEKAPLEDYYLMLQISKIAKLRYIDIPLFNYRWHSNNTIKNSEKMHKYTLTTLKYEKQFWVNNKFYDLLLSDELYNLKFRIKSMIKVLLSTVGILKK